MVVWQEDFDTRYSNDHAFGLVITLDS